MKEEKMKFKLTRLIAVALATAILVFCLSACGNKNIASENADKVTFSISCANLLNDQCKNQLPKEYEWLAAYGLAFSIVWLFLKVFQLIVSAKNASR